MSLIWEYKKVKRTGFIPAFLFGGLLASAFPVVNMAVRSEIFVNRQGNSVSILLDENWQMMAMMNVLFVLLGACILYHAEYADNAMQRMKTLPVRENSIFFGKTILLGFLSAVVFTMEAMSVVFCSAHWFGAETAFLTELVKCFGYSFFMNLPCVLLSLFLSSACKNMWVSLGIGVLCVLTATILPSDNFALSLFPFAMPFQLLDSASHIQTIHYICAATIEIVVIILAELLFIKIRRAFE